jgi:alpha-ketoglutarate-dependent taurine dioxygenase
VLLERGVGLLWDNRRMLHGRRPFQETTSSRRLRRIYGLQDDRRAN